MRASRLRLAFIALGVVRDRRELRRVLREDDASRRARAPYRDESIDAYRLRHRRCAGQPANERGRWGWTNLFDDQFRVPQEATLPTSFSIAAGASADQVVLIRVTAIKEGETVDLREAQIQVPTNRIAALTMILARSCLGQVTTGGAQPEPSCDAGQSCQPLTGRAGPL